MIFVVGWSKIHFNKLFWKRRRERFLCHGGNKRLSHGGRSLRGFSALLQGTRWCVQVLLLSRGTFITSLNSAGRLLSSVEYGTVPMWMHCFPECTVSPTSRKEPGEVGSEYPKKSQRLFQSESGFRESEVKLNQSLESWVFIQHIYISTISIIFILFWGGGLKELFQSVKSWT